MMIGAQVIVLLSPATNSADVIPVELQIKTDGQKTAYVAGLLSASTGKIKIDHEESSYLDLSQFDSVTYYLRHDGESLASLNESGPMRGDL